MSTCFIFIHLITCHLTKLPFQNTFPLSDIIHAHRKLLTPPTAPSDQNAPVGMATATLDDLQQIMPVCKICLAQTQPISNEVLGEPKGLNICLLSRSSFTSHVLFLFNQSCLAHLFTCLVIHSFSTRWCQSSILSDTFCDYLFKSELMWFLKLQAEI